MSKDMFPKAEPLFAPCPKCGHPCPLTDDDQAYCLACEYRFFRKLPRGFAAMTLDQRRAIASKGGKNAHKKGVAHQWTREEARAAGSKGGTISRGGRGKLNPAPPQKEDLS